MTKEKSQILNTPLSESTDPLIDDEDEFYRKLGFKDPKNKGDKEQPEQGLSPEGRRKLEDSRAVMESVKTTEQQKRADLIKWAKHFKGDDAENWVDETFTINNYGIAVAAGDLDLKFTEITSLKGLENVTIESNLNLYNSAITSVEGIPKVINGNLDLSYTQIILLKGLENVTIKGNLYLLDISAKEIPNNINITGTIDIYRYQQDLIKDAQKKGYNINIV